MEEKNFETIEKIGKEVKRASLIAIIVTGICTIFMAFIIMIQTDMILKSLNEINSNIGKLVDERNRDDLEQDVIDDEKDAVHEESNVQTGEYTPVKVTSDIPENTIKFTGSNNYSMGQITDDELFIPISDIRDITYNDILTSSYIIDTIKGYRVIVNTAEYDNSKIDTEENPKVIIVNNLKDVYVNFDYDKLYKDIYSATCYLYTSNTMDPSYSADIPGIKYSFNHTSAYIGSVIEPMLTDISVVGAGGNRDGLAFKFGDHHVLILPSDGRVKAVVSSTTGKEYGWSFRDFEHFKIEFNHT